MGRILRAYYTESLTNDLRDSHNTFRTRGDIGVPLKLQKEYERLGYRIPRRFSREKRKQLLKKLNKCWEFWEIIDAASQEIRKDIDKQVLKKLMENYGKAFNVQTSND